MQGFALAVIGASMLTPSTGQAQLPAVQSSPVQSSWHCCRKCNSLFFDGYVDKGRCAAGGQHEAETLDFQLTRDAATPGQRDWRHCGKCHVLFFDGNPDKGRCPSGGGHVAAGYNFVVQHDVAGPEQHDWRFCSKCGDMFYDGSSFKGRCSAGGGHAASGFNFALPWIKATPPIKTPPPVKALPPSKLEFDSKPIGFRSGVPVGGWSHLTLYPDGHFHFSGHFHVSGAPSYNVGLAWMVRSQSGQAFLFPRKGHLHGTFESGSRDSDWDVNGVNEDIKRNWADLVAGNKADWKAEVNMDITGIISEVKQAVEVVGQVVKVVQVINP